MEGARFRVLVNDHVITDEFADDQGWATTVVSWEPEVVIVQWAPAHTPLQPPYPYCKRYYVRLPQRNETEADRRRLANLGFSGRFTLQDNVADYQRRHRFETIDGKLATIRPHLRACHDEGRFPAEPSQAAPSDASAAAGPDYPWGILEAAGNAMRPAPPGSVPIPHADYDNIFLQSPPGVLGDGSSTYAVTNLQDRLAELGYFVLPSGSYDERTKRAVEAFQNRYLPGTNVVRTEADMRTVRRIHEVRAAGIALGATTPY